jgi:outer membrane protein TolC
MRSSVVVVSVGIALALGSAEAGSSQSVQELVGVSQEIAQSTGLPVLEQPVEELSSQSQAGAKAQSGLLPAPAKPAIAVVGKPSPAKQIALLTEIATLIANTDNGDPAASLAPVNIAPVTAPKPTQPNAAVQPKVAKASAKAPAKSSAKPQTQLATQSVNQAQLVNQTVPAKATRQPAPKSIARPSKVAPVNSSILPTAIAKPTPKAPRPVQPLPAEALSTGTLTAQSTTPAPADLFSPPTTAPSPSPITPGSPAPVTPGSTITPSVLPSRPIGPAKQGPAPDYLNPDPNPLSFPTKPDEVKLRGIQPITLQQAIDLAKQNNRTLQAAYLDLERSRAGLREQKAALFPSLNLQGGYTHSTSAGAQIAAETAQKAQEALPRSLRQGVNGDRVNDGLNAAVELTYNIYTGGRRPALIRAAEQQVRSDELAYETALSQLRLDISGAYYNLQEADENVRIRQSAVRNAEASLRDTQAQERAGLGTRFDVLRQEVQVSRARQDLINGVANQQIRRQELAQLLTVLPTIDLAAADPVDLAGTWNLSLEQSIVLALKNRSELEQLLAQRELAKQQRKVALAANMPNVGLSVQYNVADNLRDQIGLGDGYSAALNFQWNFFDGGAARARAEQQQINMRTAEVRFADSRERITLEVQRGYANLLSAFSNVGLARPQVFAAQEGLRLARLRFQAGVGTQTDVINAENDLTDSQGRLVTAILNYNRSLSSLSRAVSNPPIPTGSTAPTLPVPNPSN